MAQTSPGILSVYRQLKQAYGQQAWWPAESAFEVMVGAILTQNTRWSQVEKAIIQLKQARCLSAEQMIQTKVK
jgi:endonuclease III related protein